MNLSFLIGIVVCFAVMLIGIMQNGSIGNFIDNASLFITVGGTLAAIIASFPFKLLAGVPKHLGVIFGRGHKYDPMYYINTLTDLSQEARRKGLLALEDSISEFQDPFLRDSVMLIVDAMEPDKVRSQLESELSNIETRHAEVWTIYDRGAALGPGFGMIGTLIGLVNMLKAMNFEEEGGARELAENMAVALITTFYGSILANVVFIPIGTQLRVAHEHEMLCKELVIEGIISIQAGENPRHIKEKLLSFLTRKQRDKAAQVEETPAAE